MREVIIPKHMISDYMNSLFYTNEYGTGELFSNYFSI